MELGDKVQVYRQEVSDGQRIFRDEAVALVTGFGPEGCLDVAVFPVGGPVRFERLWWFTDDDYSGTNGAYWREFGSEPPAPEKSETKEEADDAHA